MAKLFNKLKAGLEEALEYEQGKKTLRTREILLPPPPSKYSAKDIKKIRSRENYSQGILASLLNVSIKTVQSWETGVRSPSHSSLRLLEIIDKGIYKPKIHKAQK